MGAASKLVDRLERDALVRRVPHPEDGRSSLIELTAEGARLVTAATATFETALHHAMPAAGAAPTLRSLATGLTAIADHLVDSGPSDVVVADR